MATAPITALVLTRNEEVAIGPCLASLTFCDQVIVVDSHSTDRTAEVAEAAGAEVRQFTWNRRYPKKKQWAMDLAEVRHDWVLHVDADERVSPQLAREMTAAIASAEHHAYDVPLAYVFMGRTLRHGHRVWKRSLVNRRYAHFPDVGDEAAPGITEVEGHYQPVVDGSVGKLTSMIIHDDPDPLSDWIARHNRYSDWEAHLRHDPELRERVASARSSQGQIFDRLPLKPLVFFLYCYVIKRGFRDGRAGLRYALSLAIYYWQIDLKAADSGTRASRP